MIGRIQPVTGWETRGPSRIPPTPPAVPTPSHPLPSLPPSGSHTRAARGDEEGGNGEGDAEGGGVRISEAEAPHPVAPIFRPIPNPSVLVCFFLALAAGIRKMPIGARGSRNVCVRVPREGFLVESLGSCLHLCWGLFLVRFCPLPSVGGTGGGRTPVPGGSQHLCVFKCGGQTEQICTQGSIVILRRKEKKKNPLQSFRGPVAAPLPFISFFFFSKREGRSRGKPRILKCPHLLLLPGGGGGVSKPGSDMV